jgi:hypothetical protein
MKRLLAALALAAFITALVAIALGSASSGGDDKEASSTTVRTLPRTTARPTTTAPAPRARAIRLGAVGAYDPEGDDHENDDLAPQAVDGDSSTFWRTEHYTHGFFKKGVGLLLDAGAGRTITKVTVSTDGAGSSAQIRLGRTTTGPFRAVTPVKPLEGTTNFPLEKGSAGRYVVVWITGVPPALGEAHVTEVRAFGTT